MGVKTYDSLDELARDYPCGYQIEFCPQHCVTPDYKDFGTVVGVCYSLPLEAGGRDEPALVVQIWGRDLGNVYPFEVIRTVFPRRD